jgi:hypothetical protein
MSVFGMSLYDPIKVAYETLVIVLRCPFVPEKILQRGHLSSFCDVSPHPHQKTEHKYHRCTMFVFIQFFKILQNIEIETFQYTPKQTSQLKDIFTFG